MCYQVAILLPCSHMLTPSYTCSGLCCVLNCLELVFTYVPTSGHAYICIYYYLVAYAPRAYSQYVVDQSQDSSIWWHSHRLIHSRAHSLITGIHVHMYLLISVVWLWCVVTCSIGVVVLLSHGVVIWWSWNRRVLVLVRGGQWYIPPLRLLQCVYVIMLCFASVSGQVLLVVLCLVVMVSGHAYCSYQLAAYASRKGYTLMIAIRVLCIRM